MLNRGEDRLSFPDCVRCARAHLRFLSGRLKDATNASVIVFPERKISYVPIPKAANLSIRAALLPLLGIRPDTIKKMAAFDGFDIRRWGDVESIITPEWFLFTVVRNPFRRFASAYFDKVVQRREVLPAFRGMGIAKGDSFGRFAHVVASWPRRTLNDHLMPQSFLLHGALRDSMLRVYRVETLWRDWPIVSAEIGSRTGIVVPPLEHRNPSPAQTHWTSVYTEETVEIVKQVYAEDFASFGYPLEFTLE